jgi:hypothetical protein
MSQKLRTNIILIFKRKKAESRNRGKSEKALLITIYMYFTFPLIRGISETRKMSKIANVKMTDLFSFAVT